MKTNKLHNEAEKIHRKVEKILDKQAQNKKYKWHAFFNQTVYVMHQDGSFFEFRNATCVLTKVGKKKNSPSILSVFSEHCGDMFFFAEDLEYATFKKEGMVGPDYIVDNQPDNPVD